MQNGGNLADWVDANKIPCNIFATQPTETGELSNKDVPDSTVYAREKLELSWCLKVGYVRLCDRTLTRKPAKEMA